jgi:hypothetical protein
MFLTQKHSSAPISVDGAQAKEILQEETIRQNSYVLQEIENILEDYPEHPYQAAFSIKELREKLVAHVLRHLPTRYSGLGETQEPTADVKFSYRSKLDRVRLDVLIRGSILHLLRENADWISRHTQRLDNSGSNTLETFSSTGITTR